MKKTRVITAALVALFIQLPIAAYPAASLYVTTTDQDCPSASSSDCFGTLQAAIDEAESGAVITIYPGTYAGATINKDVAIEGVETARTFLKAAGSGAVLTITSTAGSTLAVRRLTFNTGTIGILIQNAPSITVSNSVFALGRAGTAVSVANSTATLVSIRNNVFYNNQLGILLNPATVSNPITLTTESNIFSGNALAIDSDASVENIRNNLFFPNSKIGPAIILNQADDGYKNNISGDPLFVDPDNSDVNKRDFHLMTGSPAIDAGHSSSGDDAIDGSAEPDMGAYGGNASDKIPFPVSNLQVVTEVSGTTPVSILLSWDQNKSYQVGGYLVYSRTTGSSYGTPIDTLSSTASYTVSGLASFISTAITGTTIVGHSSENNRIVLDWSASTVTGATGYEIRYDQSPGIIAPPDPPAGTTTSEDAGSAKTYTLANLVNGTTYYFRVTPYAQTVYHFSIKPYYKNNNALVSGIYSNEAEHAVNDKTYGQTSAEDHDFPEAVSPFPYLPDQGCFIATAAYGHYSAEQVQALRKFRDAYLLKNRFGKTFVAWYYRYGPEGAAYMNSHPWLKPLARAALLPAVFGSLLLTGYGLPGKLFFALVLAGLPAVFILHYRKRRQTRRIGGSL